MVMKNKKGSAQSGSGGGGGGAKKKVVINAVDLTKFITTEFEPVSHSWVDS